MNVIEFVKQKMLKDDNKSGMMSKEAWKELKQTWEEGDKYWNKETPRIDIPKDVCSITKRAMNEYNTLTAEEFWNRNACSKTTYLRRVKQYGDPYLYSPLSHGASK